MWGRAGLAAGKCLGWGELDTVPALADVGLAQQGTVEGRCSRTGWGHRHEWVLVTLPSAAFENPKWNAKEAAGHGEGLEGREGALAQEWPLRLTPGEEGRGPALALGPRPVRERLGQLGRHAGRGMGSRGCWELFPGSGGRAEAQALL